MNKIRKAIIPVAGLGTRMLPATKAIPKELLPIVDKPLIQYVVEEAIEGGVEEIIFITRNGKEAIENHFDVNFELEHKLKSTGKRQFLKSIKNLIPKKIKISSVRQEEPLGLGDAILCAKHLINKEDFAVLLPDEILISNNAPRDFIRMINFYNVNNTGQLLVEKVKKEEISKYGIVDINKKTIKINSPSNVHKLIEKPSLKKAPSNLRVVGRYILPNQIMSDLEKIPKDKFGEYQLTNAIDRSIREGNILINAVLTDSKIFDCGSKKGFLGANMTLALRDKNLKKYLKEIIKN